MSDIKVRLSLSIPGAQMISREEALQYPVDSYETHRFSVESTDKKGHKKKETIVVKTRKPRMVKQSIQITKEAYDYMLETPPSSERIRGWNTYRKNQRLNSHFRAIAESLGATDFHFEILDD